ncbi:MAG: hypothetical protein JNM13_15580 [Hyphomicrobiaceae bacterium]|nr:hypothetical protein [Hyphomicrobiaceae bacterium]
MKTDSYRLRQLLVIFDICTIGGEFGFEPRGIAAFRHELEELATRAEAREQREVATDLVAFARDGGPRPGLGLDVVDLIDMVRSIPRTGSGADAYIDRCRAMAAFCAGEGADPRRVPPTRPCGRGAIARPDMGPNVVTLPVIARPVPATTGGAS